MAHIGIKLRITSPEGRLVELDSDFLHYRARMASPEPGAWHEVFPGAGMTYGGSRALVVEVQAVELPDSYPED